MRVLAINDISCVGKCSLTVSLPIISACGITCDVLPTALLSTHTGGFDGYTFLDLTGEFHGVLKQWKSLNLRFDCIYSGYLGSQEQIDLVAQIKKEFLTEKGIFVVDPVMGDGGKLYKGFNAPYVAKMRTLCSLADYILPNLTEACYLADIPYPTTDTKALLDALKKLCPRPIVTGVMDKDVISVCYLNGKGEEERYSSQNVDGFFHGAGDVFSSAFVGAIMKGKTEEKAIQLAANFTTSSIRRSAKEVEDKRYGLNFEAEIFEFLKNLNG